MSHDLKTRAAVALEGVTDGPWSLCAHLHSDEVDEGCSCGYRGVIFGPEGHAMAVCQPGHDTAPTGEEGTEPQRYDRATERRNSRFISASRDLVPELLARVVELESALAFYANDHYDPNDGPWGAKSKDFGNVAREALEGK